MSTLRGYIGTDISADTGEISVLLAPLFGGSPPDPGFSEDVVTLRMRLKTHTVDPDGLMLATVRWHDGNSVQEWNVSLSTTENPITDPPTPNYSEQGLEVWFDHHRDLTIQIQPLAGAGSIDLLLDYVEL